MKTTLPTRHEAWMIYDAPNTTYEQIYFNYKRFTHFLLQKLSLWMFIPCNEKGEPLEKPERYNEFHIDRVTSGKEFNKWYQECKQYQKAESRVLFKGFKLFNKNTLIDNNGNNIYIFKDNSMLLNENNSIKSIQDLLNKVDLVEWKYKELGL